MLHYEDRASRIHILTLDRVLASDVVERLHSQPGMESVELVLPVEGEGEITVADLARHARATTTSRVLVLDVRRQTKARLQGVYSDIVRFNRPDFNRYCYSVVIGDGPAGLLDPGKHLRALYPFLSDLRVDYSPAVFFTNPFLHYTYEETQVQAVHEGFALPTRMPRRLRKYFKRGDITLEQMSRYWRAADVPGDLRNAKRIRRQEELRALCMRILRDEFPQDAGEWAQTLTKEGYGLVGEPLRISMYPFFFAEWVSDLTGRAQSAAQSGHSPV